MSMFRRFADNRDPRSLAARLRRRRAAWFRRLLQSVPRPMRILDVGGTEQYWTTVGEDLDASIVILNRVAPNVTRPGFTAIAGDARALAFEDGAFDVVFSNSVIEHVGGWDDQLAMAREVRRVGKRYFVQTPNRYFPIEPHFVFPGFQFLPLDVRTELVTRFALGWYPRIRDRDEARRLAASVRLLSAGELARLFPGAAIERERLAGLTKSLIAVAGFS